MRKVADVVLFPALERSPYERVRVLKGNSSTCAVYKYRARAEMSDSCTDQHFHFAILMSSVAADSSQSSKLYFGQPSLDFRKGETRSLFIFKNMRCLTYTSSLKKPSEKDLVRHSDPEGKPNESRWNKEDLELSLMGYNGKQKHFTS